jgi:hypothetical protein
MMMGDSAQMLLSLSILCIHYLFRGKFYHRILESVFLRKDGL